jgi:hypothetical protein
MTFKFIEETVLQPMIDADVGCDLLIIKVRIHPDVLDTCTDGKSILMRDYTLVNALQVIPHAQGRSIIYDAIQDRSIIWDEDTDPHPKKHEISGGPKGEYHFLFFKKNTVHGRPETVKKSYTKSYRPEWYAPLLRHPDRDLQAVFVKSSTFVQPFGARASGRARDPIVILARMYRGLTESEQQLYRQIGPMRRKIQVDILALTDYIHTFGRYLSLTEHGNAPAATTKQIKKKIMDFEYGYISNAIAPQIYERDTREEQERARDLIAKKTELFAKAHVISGIVMDRNNWELSYNRKYRSVSAENHKLNLLLGQLLTIGHACEDGNAKHGDDPGDNSGKGGRRGGGKTGQDRKDNRKGGKSQEQVNKKHAWDVAQAKKNGGSVPRPRIPFVEEEPEPYGPFVPRNGGPSWGDQT